MWRVNSYQGIMFWAITLYKKKGVSELTQPVKGMGIKMKIWILDCDVNDYENLAWGNNEYDIDLDFIQSFNGVSKEKDWNPVKLKRMYDNRKFSNTPGLSSHIPVFDKKAVDIMEEFLIGNAEILSIFCGDKEFFAINVIKVLDCIDYEASEYKTFKNGVRILRFIKYAFIEEKIENVHLFKIKDGTLKRPFVSDGFRQKVLDSVLTGFQFELVWDSNEKQ